MMRFALADIATPTLPVSAVGSEDEEEHRAGELLHREEGVVADVHKYVRPFAKRRARLNVSVSRTPGYYRVG